MPLSRLNERFEIELEGIAFGMVDRQGHRWRCLITDRVLTTPALHCMIVALIDESGKKRSTMGARAALVAASSLLVSPPIITRRSRRLVQHPRASWAGTALQSAG